MGAPWKILDLGLGGGLLFELLPPSEYHLVDPRNIVYPRNVIQDGAKRSTPPRDRTQPATVINVKTSSDANDCLINGIVVLNDGRLAMTDYKNQCVKIIDMNDGKKSERVSLTIPPVDITIVGDKKLAVTLFGYKWIQIMSLSPLSLLTYTTSVTLPDGYLGPGCYNGLFYNAGEFFLTCGNPVNSVHICDVDGNLSRQIDSDSITEDTLFTGPFGITFNGYKKEIYVSDDSNNIVCLNRRNGMVLKYKNDMLQRPRGITLDHDGHLYICSHGNNCVMQLSNGQLETVLTEQKHGILQPYAITYDTGKLYVSSDSGDSEYSNNIRVYELE